MLIFKFVVEKFLNFKICLMDKSFMISFDNDHLVFFIIVCQDGLSFIIYVVKRKKNGVFLIDDLNVVS